MTSRGQAASPLRQAIFSARALAKGCLDSVSEWAGDRRLRSAGAADAAKNRQGRNPKVIGFCESNSVIHVDETW